MSQVLSEHEVSEQPIRAFVHRTPGEPGAIELIRLRKVRSTDARVRIDSVGVCHSDLSLANGTLSQEMPVVLGHEASGTVVEVGTDVTSLAPGDRVILLWNPSCGECWFCTRGEAHLCEHATDNASRPLAVDARGETVWAGLGVGGFAEETVVPAANLVRAEEVTPDQAAMIGCATTTGVGAVLSTAKVQAGETVAVIGLGGVGLSAVQGAMLCGASEVFAIDRSEERLEMAARLGAIAIASDEHTSKSVRARTEGRGADAVLDCVGQATTIRQAWQTTRRGGRTVVVGIGPREQQVSFNPLELFFFARSLIGCVAGGLDPRRDYAKLIGWVNDGSLATDHLITSTLGLDEVEVAFRDMERGSGGRAVIHPAVSSGLVEGRRR